MATTSAAAPPRVLLLNAAVALILGSAIQVLFHEIVHWLTGALYGPSTLYSYGVTHTPPLEGVPKAVASIAAPIASLVVGVAMAYLTPLRRRGGFGHLLWLATAFTSAQEGISYAVITPFGAGDTADFVKTLNWPVASVFILMALGIAGMFWQAARWAGHVRAYAGDDPARARAFAFFAWLIVLAVNLPMIGVQFLRAGMVVTPGEMIAIFSAGMAITVFAPMSLIFYGRARPIDESTTLPNVPIAGIIAYAVMVLINLTVLSTGIRLG